MFDFIKRLFGQDWKTTIAGIGVLVFVAAKCILSGGNFFDCISEGYNIAFVIGGGGLIVAADKK